MNWSKIKTILIGILLITNAILLIQLLTKSTFERSNTLEDVLKLYAAKGVKVEVEFGRGPTPGPSAIAETQIFNNLDLAGDEKNEIVLTSGAIFATAATETEDYEIIAATPMLPAGVRMYVDLDAIPEKLYGYSAVRHVFSDAHVSGIRNELGKLGADYMIEMDAQSLSVYSRKAFHSKFAEKARFEDGEIYQASENERAAFAAKSMEMLRLIGLGGLEILDMQTMRFYDADWTSATAPATTPATATATTTAQTGAPQRSHSYTVCRLYKSLQPDGGIDTESGIYVVFGSEGKLLGIFVRDLMAIVGASEHPYDIIPVQDALFKALDRVERGDVLKRFRIVFKLNDESIPADDIVRGEMLPYYELCFIKAGKVHIRATK